MWTCIQESCNQELTEGDDLGSPLTCRLRQKAFLRSSCIFSPPSFLYQNCILIQSKEMGISLKADKVDVPQPFAPHSGHSICFHSFPVPVRLWLSVNLIIAGVLVAKLLYGLKHRTWNQNKSTETCSFQSCKEMYCSASVLFPLWCFWIFPPVRFIIVFIVFCMQGR